MIFKRINLALILFSLFFCLMSPVLADGSDGSLAIRPEIAQAEVLKVTAQRVITRENGSKATQQNLELGILTGSLAGQTVPYIGVSEIDSVASNIYNVGDKVLVSYNRDQNGQYVFYVTDYVRDSGLLWLTILFVIVILLVGNFKGFKALFSLFVSALVVVEFFVPLILKGYDPLLIGIITSFLILLAIIYLTEGWSKKSHIAVLSIAISLVVTGILSIIFGYTCRLTGTSQEEVSFLMDAVSVTINFHNLLLAAIIIGTLGVLDDVVIAQIESVQQIREANPSLTDNKVFGMAMNIGRAHLGAIINTLFLAYAGASLPLILLFNLHQEPFMSFFSVINNEDIATEIVRTLVGIIGLTLSAPIATLLAIKQIKK